MLCLKKDDVATFGRVEHHAPIQGYLLYEQKSELVFLHGSGSEAGSPENLYAHAHVVSDL